MELVCFVSFSQFSSHIILLVAGGMIKVYSFTFAFNLGKMVALSPLSGSLTTFTHAKFNVLDVRFYV